MSPPNEGQELAACERPEAEGEGRSGHTLLRSLIALISLAAGACATGARSDGSSGGSDAGPPADAITVSVESDLVASELDSFVLEIRTSGSLMFRNQYPLGPSEVTLPATLTLLYKDGDGAPEGTISPGNIFVVERLVDVSVSGWIGGSVQVLRQARTTIPTGRSALLRMPLEAACVGYATEVAPGEVLSTCNAGETCAGGTCASIEIAESELLDVPVPAGK